MTAPRDLDDGARNATAHLRDSPLLQPRLYPRNPWTIAPSRAARQTAAILTTASPHEDPALRERCGAPVFASAGAAEKLRPFTLDGTLLAGQIVEEQFEVVAAQSADALAYRFLPTGALFSGGAFLLSGDRTSSRHR